ncbi:hypothetical protein D3C87_1805560 [compost metagenome]
MDFASKQGGVNSIEEIKNHIKKWNQRKANLFKDEHIELAYAHLKGYQTTLSF